VTDTPVPTGGRLAWGSWFYGLCAGFISGGSGAVISGVAVSLTDPEKFNLKTGGLYVVIGSVFLANGVFAALAYLHQDPLPPVVTTVSSVETTKQAGVPTVTVAKVQTTTITGATLAEVESKGYSEDSVKSDR